MKRSVYKKDYKGYYIFDIVIGTILIFLGIITLIMTYRRIVPIGSVIAIGCGIFLIMKGDYLYDIMNRYIYK